MAGMGCVGHPLAFFWPLLVNMRTKFGAHLFSSNYGYSAIPGTYGTFFESDSAFATAILAICIAGIIGSRFLARPESSSPEIRNADAVEGTLLLSFVLLPVIAYTLIRVMHGGMRDAYVLASILGFVLALACALSLARPGVLALFAVFIVSGVAVHEYKFWRSNHAVRFTSPAAAVEEFMQKSGYANLPMVVSSGMRYTPLAYYASPEFSKQLFIRNGEARAAPARVVLCRIRVCESEKR
jgi:hypothetical protein